MAKLRIRVMAYEHKILDASVKQIMDTAVRYDATVLGPIPLPTEIKKYTVNRAAFVYKNAREQFEMRTHKRLIDILNPSAKIIESLTNLSLPSGVSIDVPFSLKSSAKACGIVRKVQLFSSEKPNQNEIPTRHKNKYVPDLRREGSRSFSDPRSGWTCRGNSGEDKGD